MRLCLSIALVLGLLFPDVSHAVKHIDPNSASYYPHPFQDQMHHPSKALIKRFGSMQAASLATANQAQNVAVIVVQFPGPVSSYTSCNNFPCTSIQNQIRSLPTIDTYFTQMATYFVEASYGKIPAMNFKFFGPNTGVPSGDVSAVIAGAYTLAHPM